uniref:Amino acid transporter transmembrane domain-containing protein n=1 Tax=Chromera velia CCMP2878 TaxID=1169474 RepID=A0A0G4F6N4_9ALVE|eukprot:Cvel_15402.t1-p1 / transcript=Cvel_15402.t1 / gene=Cvel_15402 / organism=Chromera_velia_CCMP2878 / gene_product=Vacuolar amino acid transporter 1, putative / transcript_product=Vacuolar amino acid transporter 1, putative / location=Cvel_scaffold1137:30294-36000(-) / protein_length=637 / sequence_SO=supercontig / SO=protein_coding / is_pseudo=false
MPEGEKDSGGVPPKESPSSSSTEIHEGPSSSFGHDTEKIQLQFVVSEVEAGDEERRPERETADHQEDSRLHEEGVLFPVHLATFSPGGVLLLSPAGPIPELEIHRAPSGLHPRGLSSFHLGSPSSHTHTHAHGGGFDVSRRFSNVSRVSVFPSGWGWDAHDNHLAENGFAGSASPPSSLRDTLGVLRRDVSGMTLRSVGGGSATAAGDVPTGSLSSCVFNSVNVLVGVGLLSFPYCARVCGWVPTFLLMAFFIVTTHYTAVILKRCVDVDRRRFVGFPEMAEGAFGKTARLLIFWMFTLELLTLAGMFLILMVDTLEVLLPSMTGGSAGKFPAFLVVAAAVAPTTWIQQLSLLAPLALAGIGSLVYLVVAMAVYGGVAGDTEGVGGSYIHPQETALFGPLRNTPIGLGLMAVGFSGHSCFPLIYSSLGKPEKWERSVGVSYGFTVFVYIVVVVLGYLMFGNLVEAEISLNLAKLPSFAFALGLVLLVLNPFGKFAVTVAPVAVSIDRLYLHRVEAKWRTAVKALTRTLLTFLVAVAAASVPSFEQVTAFVGALFTIPISLTLPCLLYLKFHQESLSMTSKIVLWLLVALSLLLIPVGLAGVFIKPELVSPNRSPGRIQQNPRASGPSPGPSIVSLLS